MSPNWRRSVSSERGDPGQLTANMHGQVYLHAFAPVPIPVLVPHRRRAALPAPPATGTRGGTFRPPSPPAAPVTAFQSATRTSFRPPKAARRCALHVSIAWRIYYHKQLKNMQRTLQGQLTPDCSSSTDLPDSDRTRWIQPGLGPPPGHAGTRSRTGDPAESRGLGDAPPGVGKRWLESDASIRVKRARRGTDEEPGVPLVHSADPRPVGTGHPAAPRPDAGRCDMSPAPGGLGPGAGLHPYRTASWEPFWDVPRRGTVLCGQEVPRGHAPRCGFFTPPLHLPLASRPQGEAVYLRGEESRHLRGYRLLHPGVWATS